MAIRMMYAMLTDPWFSFNYFNREMRDADGNQWEMMQPQQDYEMGLLLNKRGVIASGRSCGKCVVNESKIQLIDGTYTTAGELIGTDFKIQTYNEDTKQLYWTDAYAKTNGIKECYQLTLSNGFTTTVTSEHPFLTDHGWIEAKDLINGDILIQPQYVPEPTLINNVTIGELLEFGQRPPTDVIPNKYLGCTNEKLLVLLKPFLLNNGKYNYNKTKYTITIDNKEIIQQLSLVLLRYGIRCDIRKSTLDILLNYLPKLNTILDGKLPQTNNTTIHEQIHLIRYRGKLPTVAITVPETQTHIIDGILSHNTSSIEHLIYSHAITHPNATTGYVVYQEKHCRGLIQNLNKYFNKNEFTRSFGAKYNQKDRIFTLNNGHKIEIRVLGHDKTGSVSLVSLHCTLLILDEAQLLPKKIIEELLPTGMKGVTILVAGVPNDIRDTFLYYFCSRDDVMYYKYRSYESADWDETKEKEFIDVYGGKHTQAWRNLVEACFPGNQKVMTMYGLKHISKIRIGDMVLTHNNRFKPVTHIHKFDYDGPIHCIKQAYDYKETWVTPEHPIFSKKMIGKGKARNKSDRYERLTVNYPKDLSINDRIQFADYNEYNPNKCIELDISYKGVSWNKYHNKWESNINGKFLGYYDNEDLAGIKYNIESWKLYKEEGYYNVIGKTINITPQLMYALGLFLAEGSIDDYHITYSLHRKETYLVEKLRQFFIKSPSITYSKKDKSMKVTYGNKVLVKLFRKFIHGNARTKHIIYNIFSLDLTCKLEFLRGVFDGDGCRRYRSQKGRTNELIYAIGLASEDAIYQIRLLLRSVGINASITYTSEKESKIRNEIVQSNGIYRIDVYGYWAYELDKFFEYSNTEYNGKFHSQSDFDYFSRLSSNNTRHYNGVVYNLSVEEDESYTVHDMVCHNCWGDSAEAIWRPSKLVENLANFDFKYFEYHGERFKEMFKEIKLPRITGKYKYYIIGGDMGYTQRSPLHITVLGAFDKKHKVDDETKTLENYDVVYRLQIVGMASYDVAKCINYLMDYFNCKHACIDAQNVGHDVYQDMINPEIFPETFNRNKQFMIGLLFQTLIKRGTIKSIDATTGEDVEEEIVHAAKVVATDKLTELVESNRFHISMNDQGADDFEDLVTIMQAETGTKTTNRFNPQKYTNSVNEHCFIKGTKILTENGYKNIESITTNDYVLTRYGYQKVLKSWMTCSDAIVNEYTIDEIKITSTSEHRIYINGEFKSISELRIGDILLLIHDDKFELHIVDNINIGKDDIQPVYNLTIENHEEYFANGILVHNCTDALRCCGFVIHQVIERGMLMGKASTHAPARPAKLTAGRFTNKSDRLSKMINRRRNGR
jgi:intein/homing endonuclease